MKMATRLPFSRYEFPELIDREGFKHAVEVGVNLGQFSYYLLKHSKLETLIGVDAYHGKFKSAMAGARTLMQPYTDVLRYTLLRKTSVEAAAMMREAISRGTYHQKDFVYIDAAHDEASVTADLQAWAPLVRPGGILAGHDYVAARHCGVIQAVNKFALKSGWEFSLTREEWASWVFRVPANRDTLAATSAET